MSDNQWEAKCQIVLNVDRRAPIKCVREGGKNPTKNQKREAGKCGPHSY